jgi:hypothetical protein
MSSSGFTLHQCKGFLPVSAHSDGIGLGTSTDVSDLQKLILLLCPQQLLRVLIASGVYCICYQQMFAVPSLQMCADRISNSVGLLQLLIA